MSDLIERIDQMVSKAEALSWKGSETVLGIAILKDCKAFIEAHRWVSVREKPKHWQKVLLKYTNPNGKPRIIRGCYVHKKTEEHDSDSEDLFPDYDEETDTYYWPEGWYECADEFGDITHMYVPHLPISHWMPIPAMEVKSERD
jgi:hypothetical protein